MTTEEKLEKMMARIATLEEEKAAAKKTPNGPDLPKLRQLATLDPNAFYKALGLSSEAIQHIRTVAVVDTLGDQAPLQMRMAANSGASVIAAQTQNEALEALSRQVSELAKSRKLEKTQNEFKTITSDASKYPHLSKMLKAKPDRFMAELEAHGGSIEEFASAKEEDLTALLGAAPQEAPAGKTSTTPASVNTTGIKDQSKKVESAPLAGKLNAIPAPDATSDSSNKWSKETFEATKARILES